MQRKMTDKKKLMAYVLLTDPEFNCTQKQIAPILGVSQSTVSAAVKEVELRKTIHDLRNELAAVKQEAIDQGYSHPYSLPPASEVIDVNPKK